MRDLGPEIFREAEVPDAETEIFTCYPHECLHLLHPR